MAHDRCWNGERYVHLECVAISGRACVECKVKPAGTLWGPHFCPDCDVERLNRISASLEEINDK